MISQISNNRNKIHQDEYRFFSVLCESFGCANLKLDQHSYCWRHAVANIPDPEILNLDTNTLFKKFKEAIYIDNFTAVGKLFKEFTKLPTEPICSDKGETPLNLLVELEETPTNLKLLDLLLDNLPMETISVTYNEHKIFATAMLFGKDKFYEKLVNHPRLSNLAQTTHRKTGATLMHFFAERELVRAIMILNRAYPKLLEVVDNEKRTALHLAAENKYDSTTTTNILMTIMSVPIVCLQDSIGDTALIRAIKSKNNDIAKLLMTNCPELTSIPNNTGCIPLHYAFGLEDETIELLIKSTPAYNTIIYCSSEKEQTALALWKEQGMKEGLVKQLNEKMLSGHPFKM